MLELTRRQMLANSAAGLAALASTRVAANGAEDAPVEAAPRFKFGACDWSLGQRQNPKAFEEAEKIGLDGVEVSFGPPDQPFDLRDESVRRAYREAGRARGLGIASLAMGVLNQIPYAADQRTEQWVSDVVEVMPKLGVKCCLLAFFGNGDIQGDRAKQDEVIRRLKKVAPRAETAGVVLGIESWMDADEHLRILDAVNSPSVQVYYDVANMTKRGYDVGREIRRLGRDRICQMHMKENGQLLGKGAVDFAAVKDAIEAIDYTGWLIIEGATVSGTSLTDCYRYNLDFLRSLLET
jgi:sugar phosphate isomerase/epimerase